MSFLNRASVGGSALIILAASLAACSPGEADSTKKVDTATQVHVPAASTSTAEESASSDTSAVAQDTPALVDCADQLNYQPAQVVLDCQNPLNAISSITWSTWDSAGAQGTGTMSSVDASGLPSTQQVSVELSEPVVTERGSLFNTVRVNGQVASTLGLQPAY